MKENPVLFSASMVRAILEGRKTQTRRVIKPQPRNDQIIPREWSSIMRRRTGMISSDNYGGDGLGWCALDANGNNHEFRCPFGEVGDRMWVRETFRILGSGPGEKIPKSGIRDMVQYFADQDESRIARYRPSIHMPRWASRINLEITGVMAERLQEIRAEDAIAEGLTDCGGAWSISTEKMTSRCVDPRDTFSDLWSHINGHGSWDANPFVWVIDFKRIDPC